MRLDDDQKAEESLIVNTKEPRRFPMLQAKFLWNKSEGGEPLF